MFGRTGLPPSLNVEGATRESDVLSPAARTPPDIGWSRSGLSGLEAQVGTERTPKDREEEGEKKEDEKP